MGNKKAGRKISPTWHAGKPPATTLPSAPKMASDWRAVKFSNSRAPPDCECAFSFQVFRNIFAICQALPQSLRMTEPLALVFYEKLIPGQQLVNRLQDLGYRVHASTDTASLKKQLETQKPMLLVTEFSANKTAVHEAIASLKQSPATAHVAVLAYITEANPVLQETARAAGANLIASESGLLEQLPQLLEQVLRLD